MLRPKSPNANGRCASAPPKSPWRATWACRVCCASSVGAWSAIRSNPSRSRRRTEHLRRNDMRGPMAQLMQQAQRMQEDLKRAQEEIAKIEVTGQAGGGMVSVTMNGRHEVRRVAIDRKILADDPDMAEDLVAAAFNDAVNRV